MNRNSVSRLENRPSHVPPLPHQLELNLTPELPPCRTSAFSSRQSERTHLDSILKTREVEALTGRHRTTLNRWMRAGLFPQKLRAAGLSVGWRRSDVERWLSGGWTANPKPSQSPNG